MVTLFFSFFYKHNILGTLSFMSDVAFGPVVGGHAHFLNAGVDAMTLNTRRNKRATTKKQDEDGVQGLGAHLEVVVRSISSMSEVCFVTLALLWLWLCFLSLSSSSLTLFPSKKYQKQSLHHSDVPSILLAVHSSHYHFHGDSRGVRTPLRCLHCVRSVASINLVW